jgi:hypothetical protein
MELLSSQDELLAGTVPFIREGPQAGQPIMVALIAPHLKLLRAALGTDADGVRVVDVAVLGRNPASTPPLDCPVDPRVECRLRTWAVLPAAPWME